jgi:ABC-type branched-subunit amino acid transport system ATPase component
MTTCAPMLEVREIRAAYGKRDVLRGVSLTVAPGEIVTVFGGNGSGKSTLLKAIAGLLPVHQGTIHVSGVDITHLPPHDRQKQAIGYAAQGGRVFPNLTVRENLAIASSYRRADKRLSTQLRFEPLQKLAGRRAGLLSGGERQMLALELVFVQSPVLLLLDEPTAALSRGAVQSIPVAVRDYAATVGCAVLLVEQNVFEATSITDRTIQIADGGIVNTTNAGGEGE